MPRLPVPGQHLRPVPGVKPGISGIKSCHGLLADFAPRRVDWPSDSGLTLVGYTLDAPPAPGETVTLTVTDNNGNTSTCTATITVEDTNGPTAICKDITVQLDANGQGSISTADVDDGSSDACGIASKTLDITDFTCANVGANTVTLAASALDRIGNAVLRQPVRGGFEHAVGQARLDHAGQIALHLGRGRGGDVQAGRDFLVPQERVDGADHADPEARRR